MAKHNRSMMEKSMSWESFAQGMTSIYIYLMLAVFPLFLNHTKYARLTLTKYQFFLGMTITFLLPIFLGGVFLIIKKGIKAPGEIKKEIKGISITQIFVFLYLTAALFSAYFSEYRDLVWIGSGRYEGLLTIMMYILVFFMCSFYGRFTEGHFLAFATGMTVLSFIAFGQYLGLNPFQLFPAGEFPQNSSFFSTIGNSNMVSGLICLSLPLFAVYFVTKEGKWAWVGLAASSIVFLLKLIIDVDGSTIGLIGVTFFMIPVLLWDEKWLERLSRIGWLAGALSFVAFLESLVQTKVVERQLVIQMQASKMTLLWLATGIVLISMAFYAKRVLEKNSVNYKKMVIIALIVLLVVAVVVLVWLYQYDGDHRLLYEASQLMHGNLEDRFGSNRGFLWKRSVSLAMDQSLFGSGPDTFYRSFMGRYHEEVAAFTPGTHYDSAHNEFLQTWVNLGLAGLVTYLLTIVSIVYRAVKGQGINSRILWFLAPVVCYLVQSVFSFSIIIMTPLFWLMLGFIESETNKAKGIEA